MTEAIAQNPPTFSDSYAVNQQHQLRGVLEQALADFQSAAEMVALNSITDNKVRGEYMRQIGEIPKLVRAEVSSGRVGLQEGVAFAQTMRNQVMAEARAATSAQGLAIAERKKKEGLSERFLLEKYSIQVQNPTAKPPAVIAQATAIDRGDSPSVYKQLTSEQKSKVHYAVIDAAGRDSAKFSNFCRQFATAGKVFTAMTAILSIYSIATAKDKIGEINRQAARMDGAMLGGLLGGAASVFCGPGQPICAFVFISVGGAIGTEIGERTNEWYQDELREFMKWQIN